MRALSTPMGQAGGRRRGSGAFWPAIGLIVLALLLPAGPAWAQASLSRGPYLQQGTPSSVMVQWRTSAATDSRVRYGLAPGSLTFTTDNSASTTEHIVTLNALSADTRYYYSVGSTTQTLAGGDLNHFFLTSPLVGFPKPTRVWALGDSGTANSNAAAVRNAYYAFTGGTHTDLWLMLGDNAYSDGTDSEYQAAVFNMYPEMLRKSVLWPTLGNHDGHTADSATLTGPYYDIFTLPRNAEAGGIASGTEAYYSFDYGNIHFICLDSYDSDRSPSGAMLTWLQNDLAVTAQDWVVAFWHHPPYSKGSHDSDSSGTLSDMRENALPILEQGGVDLVLSGHSHSYERSFLLDGHYGTSSTLTEAMKKNSGDGREDGTGAYAKPSTGPAPHEGAVYVVAGSSGGTGGGSLNHPAMFISLNELGSVVLDVNADRMDIRFLGSTGLRRDYLTILKGPGTPPLAPSGLTATAVSANQINLAWTDNSTNEDGFQVDRSPDGTVWSPLATVGRGVTTYANTGLSPSTTYFYSVRAFNAVGDSANSNTTSATTPAVTAPSGLTATAVSMSQIDLAWTDNSTNEDGFRIERSPNGSAWSLLATVGPNLTAHSDAGLIPSTIYFYRIQAFNAAGDSPFSNTASAATLSSPPTPPDAPSNLTASAVSSSQIDLAWTDNSTNEDAFHIERSPNGSSGWSQVASVGPNTTAYSDTGRSASTTYFYRIRASNAGGSSAYSNTASATTPALDPITVLDVRVSSGNDDAEQQTTSTNLGSTDLELTVDGSINQFVGMRFNNVIVPKGATIVTAYLQFKVDEASSTATSLVIAGEASDNAATFTSAAGTISSRPKTSATASWNPLAWPTVGASGPDQRTPSLAPVIQEIVNRPGWVSGNSQVIIITGDGLGKRVAESYNGDPGGAPLLHVEYRTGAAANQPPTVNAGADQTITLPSSASLGGTASDDGLPGGTLVTTWSQLSGPGTVTFGNASALNTTATFPTAGVYQLQLMANDGALSTSDALVVTVNPAPANQPPTVNAGADQTITLPNAASLNGSASDDGLPNPPGAMTFNWTRTAGPGTVSFSNPTALSTNATFTAAGTYTLSLTANDAALSATDQVIVTVNPAPAGAVTVEVRVTSSSDDAEERAATGKMSLTSRELQMTADGSVIQIVGMRFGGVAIPQGATILNAYVQFKVDETASTATSLTVQGQAADNALTFTTATGNISSRPRTGAGLAWTPIAWTTVGASGPDQRTSDIASVIQEIVSRSGWVSGNALAILVSGTGKRVAESYNGDKAGAPLLHVEYR